MTAPPARGSGAQTRRQVGVDEAHRWIEAHCRYATTRIPRGVVGVEAAIEYLHHLPAACRRMLPDLTGGAPSFAAAAVRLGLLATTPSEKVARAMPRLIASVSPVIEPRSPRIWTGWIAHLLDPEMQALLREETPPSQLEVAVDLEPEQAISRRALKRRLAELGLEVERLTDERDRIVLDRHAMSDALESARREAAGHRAQVEAQEQALAELRSERERIATDHRAAIDALESARREAASYRARVEAQELALAELRAERDAVRSAFERTDSTLREVRDTTLVEIEQLKAGVRRIEDARTSRAAAEKEVARVTAENEELQRRLKRWRDPTPILHPAASDHEPGWTASFDGRTIWIRALSGRLGTYELRVEAPDAPVRTYGGLLGQVVLFVHFLHAGESEEEAGKIARVTKRGASGG